MSGSESLSRFDAKLSDADKAELDAEASALEAELSGGQIAPMPGVVELIPAAPISVPAMVNQEVDDKVFKSKMKLLQGTLDGINKEHGKGTINVLTSEDLRQAVPCIPTGILSVDITFGGGFPRGRIIELYGPEGSGKTTLALAGVASTQRLGGIAAVIDAEHAFDAARAAQLGVDLDKLILCQPDYGEQALDIAEKLLESKAIDFMLVDSVAALVPKAEFEAGMDDQQQGLMARMLGKGLRKIKGKVRHAGTALVFINQVREKIGVMYGNPEVTPGGKALKFFADIRAEIRRSELLKAGDMPVGQQCVIKCVKNKIAPPHIPAYFDLYYDNRSIDIIGNIIDVCFDQGMLIKAGAWVTVPLSSTVVPELAGKNIGQGKENATAFLTANLSALERLRLAVTNKALEARRKLVETLAQGHRNGSINLTAAESQEQEDLQFGNSVKKRRKAKDDK